MIIELPGAIRQSDGTWTKTVEITEMSGKDEDILGDATFDKKTDQLAVPMSERLTRVFSRNTVAIGTERRPDGKSAKDLPNFFEDHWRKAFVADRYLMAIRLRQISVIDGDIVAFHVACPHCGNQPEHRVRGSLKDLEVKTLPLELFQGDGSFDFELPGCGEMVKWTYLRGDQEESLAKIREKTPSKLFTMATMSRLTRVGEQSKVTYDLVSDLPKRDLQALREEMARNDYGAETDFTTTCVDPECGLDFKTAIPVGSMDFFFPQGD